jgi:hypothetical protein
MTAIANLLDPTDRERLVAWMRELAELEQLEREVSKQSPPDTPPALAEMATRIATTRE